MTLFCISNISVLFGIFSDAKAESGNTKTTIQIIFLQEFTTINQKFNYIKSATVTKTTADS